MLTLQQLESHLWGAADILRGKIDSSDYKHYILGLLFFKRICGLTWEAVGGMFISEPNLSHKGRAFDE